MSGIEKQNPTIYLSHHANYPTSSCNCNIHVSKSPIFMNMQAVKLDNTYSNIFIFLLYIRSNAREILLIFYMREVRVIQRSNQGVTLFIFHKNSGVIFKIIQIQCILLMLFLDYDQLIIIIISRLSSTAQGALRHTCSSAFAKVLLNNLRPCLVAAGNFNFRHIEYLDTYIEC